MATSEKVLKFFAKYIEDSIGIVYSDSNYFQLEHRLNDIALLLSLQDVNDLFEKARGGISGQMKELLLDLATNNETSFFRDAAVFKAVTSYMVPEIVKAEPALAKLKVWSAAASTGQEAHSIAMQIESERSNLPGGWDYELLLTDFSERVLEKCKSGVYSQLEVQRGLPARLMVQFFENASDNTWKSKDSLRAHMQFKKMNLIEPFPVWEQFHIIFCRNVLIYQTVENKKLVMERLVQRLHPKGFLVLGAAESMLGVSDAFEQIHHESAVFYRLK